MPNDRSLDARTAARRLLTAVLVERRMLTEAAAQLSITGPEAARAQRLATTTLRYLGKIDACLRPHLERMPARRVQMILRLAVAELMVDGTAPHGVVDAAVSAARAVPKTARQAGLVNAVLRKVSEDHAAWEALPPPSLPPWIRKALAKAYGQDRLSSLEASHLWPTSLDLTLKGEKPKGLEGTHLPSDSLRLVGGQVTALPGFEDGAFWVQDAAAALPVRALGDVEGCRVLDLCAAPGGKTMQLAARGAKVTAVDLSEGRLKRLTENLTRTKLAAEIIVADVLDWSPDAPFDVILLDAPCSATGTIRRHPDLPYLRKPQDIEALTRLQYQMIDRALGWLKPGGRMVYCTCSLLPVEGERQVSAALKRHPHLALTSLDPSTFGLPQEAAVPEGLRLLPDMWPEFGGLDGFFIGQFTLPA